MAQAESQLKTAQAATVDMKLARSQLEHSIAVSIGQAPSTLTIDMAKADPYLPQIPAGLPSALGSSAVLTSLPPNARSRRPTP